MYFKLNLRVSEINKNTFTEWCRIDDNEELFLTIKRPGGGPRKTSNDDDSELRALALGDNRWDGINRLRQTETIIANERLSNVSDTTLRRRLSEQGKLGNLL